MSDVVGWPPRPGASRESVTALTVAAAGHVTHRGRGRLAAIYAAGDRPGHPWPRPAGAPQAHLKRIDN